MGAWSGVSRAAGVASAVLALGVLVLHAGGGAADGGGVGQVVARHSTGARLPVAAEAPVSRMIGRDRRPYWATASRAGFLMRNGGQGLRARFGSGGVVVSSGSARLALRLAGYGSGRRLQAVSVARPVARAIGSRMTVAGWSSGTRMGLWGWSRGSRFRRVLRVPARAR